MMDFITIPAVVGIVALGVYKLFELFVRKKERMMIVEKIDFSNSDGKPIDVNIAGNPGKFPALRFGCLFAGIGLGLLIAFFIVSLYYPGWGDAGYR
ncbi:MAG: hypothetical protein LBU80_01350, partial [Rikenellaceae bacterium]|nr:hypothetical protein [Rikenellaceae bacterium]